jgi:hypothetical protein
MEKAIDDIFIAGTLHEFRRSTGVDISILEFLKDRRPSSRALGRQEHVASLLQPSNIRRKSCLRGCHEIDEQTSEGTVQGTQGFGMVFKLLNLYPHKTVLENLCLRRCSEDGEARDVEDGR